MSSEYSLICLSHDPAIEVYEIGNGNADQALAEAARNQDHHRCDIAVGRYSASLVEVACLSNSPDNGRQRGHLSTHRDVEWVDAVWLRALCLALDHAPSEALKAANLPFSANCWPPERLNRIRGLLGVPSAQGGRE